jgi:hypothetical protein
MVREAMAKFRAVQESVSQFGAGDSEPDYVWQKFLITNLPKLNVWHDAKRSLPRSRRAWEL